MIFMDLLFQHGHEEDQDPILLKCLNGIEGRLDKRCWDLTQNETGLKMLKVIATTFLPQRLALVKPVIALIVKAFGRHPSDMILDMIFDTMEIAKLPKEEKLNFLRKITTKIMNSHDNLDWGNQANIPSLITKLVDKNLELLELELLPLYHGLTDIIASLSGRFSVEMINLLVDKCQSADVVRIIQNKMLSPESRQRIMTTVNHQLNLNMAILELLCSDKVAAKAPG